MRAHEHIVEQLQNLILGGKLPPGSRLPSERAMMGAFNVSRPTVREALRVAESMGLIAVRPGDPGGPKVLGAPSVGIRRVLDSLLQAGRTSTVEVLQMRIVLDTSAAALASMQPAERLYQLREVLRQMEATIDLREFAELDVKFHEAVIVASGNRLFHLIFQGLSEPIRALIEMRFKSTPNHIREEVLLHHNAIVDAMQSGDPHRAANDVRMHLQTFYLPVLSPKERLCFQSFMQAIETGQ